MDILSVNGAESVETLTIYKQEIVPASKPCESTGYKPILIADSIIEVLEVEDYFKPVR